MNYKSQNGVTMVGLIIYVGCFLVVAGIVGAITVFFYNNTSLLNNEVYSSAEYNKLNMYLVKESEEEGNSFVNFDSASNMYTLTFSNGNIYTFDKDNHILYFNKICLCEDVQNFKVTTDYKTGIEKIKVEISFTDKSYTTNYSMSV